MAVEKDRVPPFRSLPLTRPTLSIILCTRNRPADLDLTLRALAAQSHPPDEVLVIDSGDDPAATRAALHARLGPPPGAPPWRHVVHPPGLTRQRNAGARLSRGALLCFLDDDVTPAPGYCARLCDFFARQPAARGVEGRDLRQDRRARNPFNLLARLFGHQSQAPRGFRYRSGAPAVPYPTGGRADAPVRVAALAGFNMTFRREVFYAHGGFDHRLAGYTLADDDDFSGRVAAGGPLYRLPDLTLEHRVSPQHRPDFARRARLTVRDHWFQAAKNHRRRAGFRGAWRWAGAGYLAVAALKRHRRARLAGTIAGLREVRRNAARSARAERRLAGLIDPRARERAYCVLAQRAFAPDQQVLVADLLRALRPSSLIDLGCGVGRMFELYAAFAPDGAAGASTSATGGLPPVPLTRVRAVDYDPVLLAQAAHRAPPGITLECADLRRWPGPAPARYDLAVSIRTLEGLDRAAVARLLAVLAPGVRRFLCVEARGSRPRPRGPEGGVQAFMVHEYAALAAAAGWRLARYFALDEGPVPLGVWLFEGQGGRDKG